MPTRLAATVSTDSAAESTTTADLEKTLLRAVGNEDRSERDILDAAAALERWTYAPAASPAMGFSVLDADRETKGVGRQKPGPAPGGVECHLLGTVQGRALPGRRPGAAATESVLGGQRADRGGRGRGTVDNRVSLTFNKQKIDIRVFGAARPTDDDDTLEICFEGFELGGLPIGPIAGAPWGASSRPSSTTTCACRGGVAGAVCPFKR